MSLDSDLWKQSKEEEGLTAQQMADHAAEPSLNSSPTDSPQHHPHMVITRLLIQLLFLQQKLANSRSNCNTLLSVLLLDLGNKSKCYHFLTIYHVPGSGPNLLSVLI